jgi:hypothetical protein
MLGLQQLQNLFNVIGKRGLWPCGPSAAFDAQSKGVDNAIGLAAVREALVAGMAKETNLLDPGIRTVQEQLTWLLSGKLDSGPVADSVAASGVARDQLQALLRAPTGGDKNTQAVRDAAAVAGAAQQAAQAVSVFDKGPVQLYLEWLLSGQPLGADTSTVLGQVNAAAEASHEARKNVAARSAETGKGAIPWRRDENGDMVDENGESIKGCSGL